MSELVERQFPAKALLTGLRAIGYNFSTAVADIIDNSISAGGEYVPVSQRDIVLFVTPNISPNFS